MRLVGRLYVTVRADIVRRDPTVWERLKSGLGARVNLDTDEVQNQLEATAVVDSVRRALNRLGVSNAVSLVIDDTVIFQDSDGRPQDLPDLVLALSEHASVFGRGFRELRFAAEHEEAGLHLVIETRARTRHRREDPAAVVSVGGRIRALEPLRNESAEDYRARVEPLLAADATANGTAFASARLAFESFVTRLHQAVQSAMPDAIVEERKAEALLVKTPDRDVVAPQRTQTEPTHPAYDPFAIYYPSPVASFLDAMMFASFMHMLMPPPVMVVSPWGMPLGTMEDVRADPGLASDDRMFAAHESSTGVDNASVVEPTDTPGDEHAYDDNDSWIEGGAVGNGWGDDGGGDWGDAGDLD